MRKLLKNIANTFGYDILHLPTNPLVRRRLDLLARYNISRILDVGANTGQYALWMREMGYLGEMVSFEPIPEAFSELSRKAAADPGWSTVNHALGNENGTATLHISKNSYSSSLLAMTEKHLESAPDSEFIAEVEVPVKRLDEVFADYGPASGECLVKIDTQGFEHQVFEGCSGVLDSITGFQMELSLAPLYEGETLLQEMLSLLSQKGYLLMLMEEGHRNYETGEILQVETMFFKTV